VKRIAFAAIALVAAQQVIAQVPVRPVTPPGVRDALGRQTAARADSLLRDTTLIRWTEPDSAMRALLAKPGYTRTRYQGAHATFDAQQRALELKPALKGVAAVQRGPQLIVSDSGIFYRESVRQAVALGHYVAVDSGSGQADIRGFGHIEYSMNSRMARAFNANLPKIADIWFLKADVAAVLTDSVPGKRPTAYMRGGSLTSCDDSIPDYHFEYREAKGTNSNTIVARPAILYIKDIPVMWLPFVFTDTKTGRRSGILTPRFGVGDIVRNSPTYRRNVENVGYYWALNDYMDAGLWLDWRSGAGGGNQQENDPGWIRYTGEWQYKWIDRFLAGRLATAYTRQRDGNTNLAVTWGHQQEFSRNSHVTTNLNYVSSTTLQRQNTFNPYTSLATIASSIAYQQKIGLASLSLGGTRKQYPGRDQVDQTLPTISLTTGPINVAKWLTWTPSFNYTASSLTHIDQPGIITYRYFTGENGLRDSSKFDRSSYSAQASFDTPIKIFGVPIANSFRVNQQRNDFPEQKIIYDVQTGAQETRIFASTFRSDIDWTPGFEIPAFPRNRFNFSPSISLQNVDPGPFAVKTERTNGEYVHQSKRLTLGLSASPTLYGFFPGISRFAAFRHSIITNLGFSMAPRANVSDEFLQAVGATRVGYRGGLPQKSLSFGLSTNFEGKLKSPTDTANIGNGNQSRNIKLVSVQFTPLAYDFELAKQTGRSIAGLTTQNFGYSIRSDMLPGFDFSTTYSLFEGSTLSDTSVFKPYRENVSATFNISNDQNPFVALLRLFGKAVPEAQKAPVPATDQVRPRPDDQLTRQIAAAPVAGTGSRGERFLLPSTEGWRASFTFSSSRPRPPRGPNVVDFDARARCEQLAAAAGNNPFILNQCLEDIRIAPTNELPVTSTTFGGQAYRIPATTSLSMNTNFPLTTKWAAGWQTNYDFERHEFASHIVQLQRDLHDWRAIFAFTQSPNGNFAFNFSIGLKAEPDLKFDYNRATVRAGSF
jgi:hypothetical protein